MSPLTIKKIYYINAILLGLIFFYEAYETLSIILTSNVKSIYDDNIGELYYCLQIGFLIFLNIKKVRLSIILSVFFICYSYHDTANIIWDHIQGIYYTYKHEHQLIILRSWSPDLTYITLRILQVIFGITITLCALYQFLFKNRKLMSVAI